MPIDQSRDKDKRPPPASSARRFLSGVLWLGLVATPADRVQGDAVRLMYLHVPMSILAFLAFGVTALGSLVYLRKQSEFWDLTAAASAEVGVVFTGLSLATGMLWGRPTWGVFWVWDARGTTTVLLLVLFLGYLAVRRVPAEPRVRSRRAAVVGLLAFIDVPIVHFSVDWWRTLHQGPTVTRLDPQIDGLMLFTLMFSIATFALVYLWLLTHRFRLGYLQDRIDARAFDLALAERQAEAQPPPLASTGSPP